MLDVDRDQFGRKITCERPYTELHGGIVWSLLAVSGLFALVSPAPAYVPLAVGSIMTLVFLKKATGSFKIPLQLLVVTSLFGVMVTGFTAYIRYIYPVLIVWPLIALMKND